MNTSELKSKLLKSLDFLKLELNQIRTGRATPALIEEVAVEAYGARMTLKELGAITLLDNQNLLVSPWDKNLLGTISKAIREAGLGLNPVEESDKLRVPIPALTEERRKEFAKMVSGKVEDCKNAMRASRQDIMKDIEKEFTDKKIGEDDKFRNKEEVEKIVKDFISQADDLGENKKQELLTI